MTIWKDSPLAREAIARAEELCERRGARLTDLRRRAIALLAEAQGPVKAYDLLPGLGTVNGPAKPASAYRTLEFLEELGIVHRVAGLNAFVLCDGEAHGQATALFICETCNKSVERPVDPALLDQAPAGFTVSRVVIEIYGECAECQVQVALA